MSWWLFLQLFLLILLVGLIVSAIIESGMRELYKNRDQNEKNAWCRDWPSVPETPVVKDPKAPDDGHN